MRKVETSIRFSPGTLERWKYLAHIRSLESGKAVTWNQMVRECVDRHLLAGIGVNADLPGEKKQILVPEQEVEHVRILEEETSLLRNLHRIRSQVEFLLIHIRIREIGVHRAEGD